MLNLNYGAELTGNDEVVVREQSHESAKTRILVLDNGKVIFEGGLSGFQSSDLPAVKRLLTLDPNDHTDDPYFQNPWDRRRHSREKLL